MTNDIFLNGQLTERSLIESILASHYIIDYGFIKNVNPDKTIDVTHAKQLKTYEGKSLKPTVTQKVEVLTISGGGFSIKFDYKKGDGNTVSFLLSLYILYRSAHTFGPADPS
jgi:hypothetical protein